MEDVYLKLSFDDYTSIIKSLSSAKNKKKVEILQNAIVKSEDIQNLHLQKVHNAKIEKSKDIILKEFQRLKSENTKATIYNISKNTNLSYHTVKKYFFDIEKDMK